MKSNIKNLQGIRAIVSLVVLVLIAGFGINPPAHAADSLYVGDGSDNTIKRFDATTVTNNFQGIFAKGGLKGPMGMVFDLDGDLIVSNQNVNTSTHGELLLYAGDTGALLRRIVANSDPNAPAISRGIVLSDGTIFVAEFSQLSSGNIKNKSFLPGRLLEYSETDGQLLAAITPPSALIPRDQFHPRGVVFGPEGLLYISNVPNPPPPVSTGLGGQVLRYNLNTGAFDIFVDDDVGGVGQLNRPEGLVFGPDGNLYITSFRDNSNIGIEGNTDMIRIYNGTTGSFIDKIDLDVVAGVGQPRAFAQALLFGPGDFLFVPITGNGPDTGAVRRYNVTTKTVDNFVPPAAGGGPLGEGWYLTFGDTDPGTLEYIPIP